MDFWSKGLGRRTVALHLAKGDVRKSDDTLYVSGTMEEPITWDYIMKLQGDDLVEFLALLREPRVAEYLYRSPRRRQLYTTLATRGLRFLVLLVLQIARLAWARLRGHPAPEEPTIEVPPPRERKRRTPTKRRRLASRAATEDDEADETEVAVSG